MITAIIITYLAVVAVMFTWAWVDRSMQTQKRGGMKFVGWFIFPALASILYFQQRPPKEFQPKFNRHEQ
jgi:hypothetical protein